MKNIKKSVIALFSLFIIISTSILAKDKDKLKVVLFYSPHCGACIRLEKEFLSQILEKYKDRLTLEALDIDKPKNLSVLVGLAKQFPTKKAVVPTILIGNTLLNGVKEIESNLETLIDRYSGRRTTFPYFFSGVNLIEKFKKLSIFTIIGGGLLDGINPCAFAVIVFFISFLTVYGYNKQEIIYVGSFYILSVFITYILIGLGLFSFLYSLRHFYLLMRGFYYMVAALCLTLAVFSFYDFFRYKKSGTSDGMVLQLPMFLKKKINIIIGKGLRKKNYTRIIELCLISFVVGVCVSILEAACTGQVYIPTIVFILKIPSLRLKAFTYLVLYNIMFVFPLIIIFVLALFGFTSQQFSKFLKRNLGLIKAALGWFFLGLAVLMVWLK